MPTHGTGPVDPSRLDDVLSALADDTRRQVLRRLRATPETDVPVEDLVVDLAARDGSPDDTTIAVELRHVTLPKLDDADLVEYDRRDGSVRYRECPLVEEIFRIQASVEDGNSTSCQ